MAAMARGLSMWRIEFSLVVLFMVAGWVDG